MPQTEITNYLTISQVVKDFMSERNEQGIVNYERYLQMCINGFSDIAIFNLNSVNVAYLSVDPDTKIARLPMDFIKMSKIGINICNRFWTFTLNNDLVTPRPETICAEPIETCDSCADTITGGYFFAPHWYNGVYVSALYGLSGGFNTAYYKIDEPNWRILFSGYIPNDEVILEYISSGVTAGGSPIPRKAAPALKAYLHWKSTLYDNRISQGDKRYYEELYNKELYSLSRLENTFTISEFLDSFYSTTSQTVKR